MLFQQRSIDFRQTLVDVKISRHYRRKKLQVDWNVNISSSQLSFVEKSVNGTMFLKVVIKHFWPGVDYTTVVLDHNFKILNFLAWIFAKKTTSFGYFPKKNACGAKKKDCVLDFILNCSVVLHEWETKSSTVKSIRASDK